MTHLLRRLPRWFNRLYARTLGYFWIPWPMCKREFGGHERAKELLQGPGRLFRMDRFVCWRCESKAHDLNFEVARAKLRLEIVDEFGLKENFILPFWLRSTDFVVRDKNDRGIIQGIDS